MCACVRSMGKECERKRGSVGVCSRGVCVCACARAINAINVGGGVGRTRYHAARNKVTAMPRFLACSNTWSLTRGLQGTWSPLGTYGDSHNQEAETSVAPSPPDARADSTLRCGFGRGQGVAGGGEEEAGAVEYEEDPAELAY